MAMTIEFVASQFSSILNSSLVLSVLVFSVVLGVVSLFIWQFYKSTSKKNLLELNLRKYNKSEHPLTNKFFAIVLYLLEYIVITPVLITLWFAALSIILLLIASERPIEEVLMISAALIGAIRILAYYHSEISKDLAKLFPLIALSIFLLTPGSLNVNLLLDQLDKIPLLVNNIFSFILVVVGIEIVLRFIFIIIEFWRSEKESALDSK